MMIQRFAVAALVAVVGASAHAVEFNTDALKAMQEEGHQIVADAEGRRFEVAGGFCLDTAGNGLVVRACSDAETQKWRLDDQSFLVAKSGQCVAGASLRDCAGNTQTWTWDDSKRLVNAARQCLQVQGNAPAAGARVRTAACSGAATQMWQ